MSLELEEMTGMAGDVFEDFLFVFGRCLAKYLDIGEDMNVPDDFTQSELQTGKWWRHLLAGGIAGAVSRTCTAPLDRLKVFLQVNPTRENMSKCLARMISEGGFTGLWRGNGINVIKIAPESAIKFAAYEQVKKLIKGEKRNMPLEIHERFIAGATAGGISQTVIYPLEVLKTRLALRKTGQYSGIVDAAKKIYAREGLRCFYKGYIPNILGIVPYAGIDLAVYETLKKKYISRYEANGQPGLLLLLACGSVSCTLGQVCSYPLALIRTRLQAQEKAAKGAEGTMSGVIREIVQREGVTGLYRGITPNFIKGSVLCATLFLLHINGLLILLKPGICGYTETSKSRASAEIQSLREAMVERLNLALKAVSDWGDTNVAKFNTAKTEAWLFSSKKSLFNLAPSFDMYPCR